MDNAYLIDRLERSIAKLDFFFYDTDAPGSRYSYTNDELKDLREQLTDFIIAADNKLIYDGCGDEFLNQVLNKGFKGYSNMDFDELVKEFFQRFDSAVHLLEQLEIFFDNYYLPANSKDEVTDIQVIEWAETFTDRVYRL